MIAPIVTASKGLRGPRGALSHWPAARGLTHSL